MPSCCNMLKSLNILRAFLKTLLVCFSFIQISCSQVALQPENMSAELLRISERFQAVERVVITSQLTRDQGLGYQYLLFLPFQKVTFPGASRALFSFYGTKRAKRAIRVELSPYAQAETVITLKKLRVSAYDFFIQRRIVCNVTLEHTSNGKTQELRGQSIRWRKYAFSEQLLISINDAFKDALSAI